MTEPPDPLEATAAGHEVKAAPPPQSIGKYRLERILGAGGMGIVWAAHDPDLDRAVAIKLLHAGGSEPTLRSRLLREARAMARLKHPNVLTVYEVGTDDNRDYIAMELVDGDSLEGWLQSKPPEAEVVAALLAAGRGLAAAHAAGLVHRDFKPHNVLRSRDGHVYVTDFGLARGLVEDGVELEQRPLPATPLASSSRRVVDSVLDSPLTQTGVLVGTPAYMAPEQFAGKVPDARSDQFAFCVTAWEALAGTRPFGGATLAELEASSRGGAPRASDLPPSIRDVLARGLAADPEQRWLDVPSLLDALAVAARPRRSRKRLAIAVALGGVLVAGAVVAFALRGKREAADPCADPAAAFASAWSPEREDAVSRLHGGGRAIGAIAILGDVRRQWVRSYRESCAAKRTPEIQDRLVCLDNLRDRVAILTRRLATDSSAFDMEQLGGLAAGVMVCDPSARPFGMEIEDDVKRSLPVPPIPPIPDPR